MKKLILLAVITLFTSTVELNAQSITNPIGEDIAAAFDLGNSATNVVLANIETNEAIPLYSASELNGLNLEPGQYELSYIIGAEQHEIRFYINQD